jgi:hypothetical protein
MVFSRQLPSFTVTSSAHCQAGPPASRTTWVRSRVAEPASC